MNHLDIYSTKLDDETDMYCTLNLFKNVQNTTAVRQKILSGVLPCCLLKATIIAHPFQVVVAANIAMLNAKNNKLITKSIYTEILFYLATSKNISKSLLSFGANDYDKDLLIVAIHKSEEKASICEKISNSIKGERISIQKLHEFTDLEMVKKYYKICEAELKVSTLIDSIVSRIACKNFSSLKE